MPCLCAELRSQLQKFSVMLVHLPPLVVQIIITDQLAELEKDRKTLENDYQLRVQELEKRKVFKTISIKYQNNCYTHFTHQPKPSVFRLDNNELPVY